MSDGKQEETLSNPAVEAVGRLLYRPNGSQLAAALWEGVVRLWNVQPGGTPRVQHDCLHESGERVPVVQFNSQHSTWLLRGSADRMLRLWRIQPPKPTLILYRYPGPAQFAEFRGDDQLVLSLAADHVVCVFRGPEWGASPARAFDRSSWQSPFCALWTEWPLCGLSLRRLNGPGVEPELSAGSDSSGPLTFLRSFTMACLTARGRAESGEEVAAVLSHTDFEVRNQRLPNEQTLIGGM